MKWRDDPQPKPTMVGLRKVTEVLSRVEPYFVRTISSTPVFSVKEREDLVKKYRGIREECVDGLTRQSQTKRLVEGEEPDKTLFGLDDIELETKLQSTNEELLYFVSLGLHMIERLYLNNHISEELNENYKRLLRYLPRFHSDLIRHSERGRGKPY